MAIAEKLCDRIGILLNGKLLASGTVAELNEKYGVKSLEETFFKLADKVEIREAA
jgi:sodium transport system ATP-binding protein